MEERLASARLEDHKRYIRWFKARLGRSKSASELSVLEQSWREQRAIVRGLENTANGE